MKSKNKFFTLLALFLFNNLTLISCQIQETIKISKKVNNDKINKQQAKTDSNYNKIENLKDIPIINPIKTNNLKGVGIILKYVLKIPEIINKENFMLSIKNKLIIQKYQEILDFIGNNQPNPTGLYKIFDEYKKWIYDSDEFQKLEKEVGIFLENKKRLFYFQENKKENNDLNVDFFALILDYFWISNLHLKSSLILLDFIKNYINYQIFLLSKIQNEKELFYNQINKLPKEIYQNLVKNIIDFLNIQNHLSFNKDELFLSENDFPSSFYKENYQFILNFANNEFAPLLIKLGIYPQNFLNFDSFYLRLYNKFFKANLNNQDLQKRYQFFQVEKWYLEWKTLGKVKYNFKSLD